MKRLHTLTILAALTLLLCCLLPTKAEAATYGYYTYTVSGGQATITDCDTSISGNITIPSTLGGYPVTSIGRSAFSGCSSLSSITIPDSVTSIGNYAFLGCSSLTGIWVDTDNKNYSSDENGVLFNKKQTNLIQAPGAITTYTIPSSVTSIGDWAFRDCSSLTSITIPDSVTSIGSSAFNSCSSLTSITIPDSVTGIGSSAFNSCSSLTGITIPDSVTSIGGDAFFNCRRLTSITIGNGVTSIGSNAFEYCSSLISITIPDSVTSIGDWAFRDCSSLTSVTMGNGVTSIGDYAFRNCSSLTSITISDSVTSISNYAFDGCELVTVHYTGTRTDKNKISISSGNECLRDATWHYAVEERRVNGTTAYYCSKCGYLYFDGTKVPIQKLTITTLPEKLRYYTGDTISLQGISLVGCYSDDVQFDLSADDVEHIEADLSSPGRKTVTLTISGATATFEIVVHDPLGTPETVDPAKYPQSKHNYANNMSEIKSFTYPGAVSLSITFNSKTNVESEYDYLYVYDGADNLIAEYTGAAAANQTLTIPGDTFKIKLTSDDSTTRYGYGFASIVAFMGGEKHEPVTDPAVAATCMQTGLTEGSHCAACGEILIAQEVTAITDHIYVDDVCTGCGLLTKFDRILTEDAVVNWKLTQDLYIDLNGFDLSGTIITNGYKIYGIDNTTDDYSCDSIGYFACVDENGDFIVPERIYTEGEKQYMAICTEDRYSFHRFFVGTTHMSLSPETIGLGYKAAVFGDEMVFAELAETKAFSFKLQLEGYTPVYRHFDSGELTSGESIALRIRNYDVENFSEHNLYAQVSLTLNDGTVIETEQVSLTFRWLTEQVNENYTDYTADQLASFKAMLQQFDIVKKWNIPNLI